MAVYGEILVSLDTVTYDRAIWADLTTLRFADDNQRRRCTRVRNQGPDGRCFT